MVYKCAICGKEFDALWPDLYRYKRGGTFLCSWSCLRKYDEEKGSGNMTLMDKQKRMACEMALEGEKPAAVPEGDRREEHDGGLGHLPELGEEEQHGGF